MLNRSICVLLAAAVAGCAADEAAAPSAAVRRPAAPLVMTGPMTSQSGVATPSAPMTAGAAATPAAPSEVTPVAAAAVALLTIPAGAKFSIFCESYSGPDHVQFSTNVKGLLQKNTKLRDWYVIHQSGQSTLYHGYYAEVAASSAADRAAKRDVDRAQRDHAMVESIPSPTDPTQKLFARSLFVPLDAPDPDAPPAWNLTNAPGHWTVQVAAFTGGDRKAQTVAAVRQARAQNLPAFYYHGPNVSSVCVGSWDRAAVKVPEYMAAPGDQDVDQGATNDKNMVVNYTGMPLTDDMLKGRGGDGKSLRVLESSMEVLDASLMATLKQYPAQAVDGFEVPLKGVDKSGRVVTRPRPSMIVRIPRDDRGGRVAGNDAEPEPTLIRQPAGNANLGSRLRGIGQ